MKEKKYIIENQRELIFSYLSIGCIIGIVLFLITGGSDENKKFFFIINSIHISFIILLFFLHYFKKISTVAAIIAFALISQIEISVECIVMAIKNTPFSISLILGNITLIGLLLIFMVISYIPYIPSIITFISALTYTYCIYRTQNETLIEVALPIFVAFVVVSLMNRHLTQNISNMQKENIRYEIEQKTILGFLNMDKQQVFRFIEIMKSKGLTMSQTEEVLELLGKETWEKIESGVRRMIQNNEQNIESLKQYADTLTPSELLMCELILDNKNISAISAITGKSVSNITSTRSHIRNKLNLKKDENLREALLRITKQKK